MSAVETLDRWIEDMAQGLDDDDAPARQAWQTIKGQHLKHQANVAKLQAMLAAAQRAVFKGPSDGGRLMFAKGALQGILASDYYKPDAGGEDWSYPAEHLIARDAWDLADAMLAEGAARTAKQEPRDE